MLVLCWTLAWLYSIKNRTQRRASEESYRREITKHAECPVTSQDEKFQHTPDDAQKTTLTATLRLLAAIPRVNSFAHRSYRVVPLAHCFPSYGAFPGAEAQVMLLPRRPASWRLPHDVDYRHECRVRYLKTLSARKYFCRERGKVRGS